MISELCVWFDALPALLRYALYVWAIWTALRIVGTIVDDVTQ